MKSLWLLVVAGLIVGGCASGNVEIPLSALTDKESRGAAYTTIGDASTAKEVAYQVTRRNLDKTYKDAFLKSGVTIETAQVEKRVQIPGMKEPFIYTETVISKVTARGEPKFQKIAGGPSEHPMWRTMETLGGKLIQYGLYGWAIDSVTGAFKYLGEAVGGYNNYVNSNGGDIEFVSKRSNVTIGDSNTETAVSDINSDAASPGETEDESAEEELTEEGTEEEAVEENLVEAVN